MALDLPFEPIRQQPGRIQREAGGEYPMRAQSRSNSACRVREDGITATGRLAGYLSC
jgi:hypothetical protein